MFASDRGTLYITVYIYTAQSALSQRVISGFCTNYHDNKKRPLSPWRPRPLCVENKLKMKKILSHPPAEKKKKKPLAEISRLVPGSCTETVPQMSRTSLEHTCIVPSLEKKKKTQKRK